MIVACLDQNHDPRADTFSTCFPGFENLDRVIEEATLAYAPRFSAPEVTERFLARLRPEAGETARRLLYVALTRARDRLVIEWPQPDGVDEPPYPITAHRLLAENCGMEVKARALAIGDTSHDAAIHTPDPKVPPCFVKDETGPASSDRREPRFAILARPGAPPRPVFAPSQALETQRPFPAGLATLAVAPGWRVEGENHKVATDKGTAIHEALRILLLRPDLAGRVADHCRLNDEDVAALRLQAEGLAKALGDLGFPEIHVEQPLEIALEDGGTLQAFVDLIAEGPQGYLIVDHKSGAVSNHAARMAAYWPQLAAYAAAVELIGGRPAAGTAIFWTETGELTVARL